MSNKNQNTNFSKLDARDKIDACLAKLEFMSDAIYLWDSNSLDFNETHRMGYSHIMDSITGDIRKSMEILEEC